MNSRFVESIETTRADSIYYEDSTSMERGHPCPQRPQTMALVGHRFMETISAIPNHKNPLSVPSAVADGFIDACASERVFQPSLSH